MNYEDVNNCMRCQASLEQGWKCTRYKGDECVEVICGKCDSTERLNEYKKTGILSSRLIMDNNMKLFYITETTRDPERIAIGDTEGLEALQLRCAIQIAANKLQSKIKEFEAKVWFKGLQDQVLATRERGVSAHVDANFAVLTWTCAGRTAIQIDGADGASVGMLADETSKEPRTGFQSVNTTLEEAIQLMDRAIQMYEAGTLKFELDKKVGIGL